LTGVEAEGGQVVLGVGEDGQVAVKVSDLADATLESQRRIQVRGAGREQRQLDLRHGQAISPEPRAGQRKPAHFVSSPAPIHAHGSGGVSLRFTWSMALLADAVVLLRTRALLARPAPPQLLADLIPFQLSLELGTQAAMSIPPAQNANPHNPQ
jgi:hypothetical protein